MSDDPSYWLDHFDGDGQLAALVVGGMTKQRCGWCERELRPCNMARHIAAAHFRQLTIDDMLDTPRAPRVRPRPTCPLNGAPCPADPMCDRDERAICESIASR